MYFPIHKLRYRTTEKKLMNVLKLISTVMSEHNMKDVLICGISLKKFAISH